MSSNERKAAEGGESAGRIRAGQGTKRIIYAVGGGLVLYAVGLAIFGDRSADRENDGIETPEAAQVAQRGDGAVPVRFTPPSEDTIPDGPDGDSIRRGRDIFANTQTNAGEFVGNELSCANCHLDNGRRADSAPMWSAWLEYPKYRGKNDRINTMEDRIQGCFTYSMNAQDSEFGAPPPNGHQVYKDIQSYMFWLATGAPTGGGVEGAGYPKVEKTELGYDPARGAEVYVAHCATCHGDDGVGQRDLNGRPVFPPLWGPESYNWGAGMARINTAAAFINANMPLGQSNRLTDREAWDVAAYINSHERPRDPRQAGAGLTVEEAAARYHEGSDIYYGQVINGHLMGTGTPVPERN